MATAPNLKYMFSIKAGFPTRWVARTPAGYRIDVELHTTRADAMTVETAEYWPVWGEEVKRWLTDDGWKKSLTKDERPKVDALVETLKDMTVESKGLDAALVSLRTLLRGKDLEGLPWLGLTGRIVSGVDWALLRADGVVEFDGQWVLTDGDLDDKNAVLVNARTSGSVDLCDSDAERPFTLDHAVAQIRARKEEEAVGIALAIKFEAPQEPEPWASKKYTRREGQLRYVRLSRGQFIAIGTLTSFGKSSAQGVLRVYQVEVQRA